MNRVNFFWFGAMRDVRPYEMCAKHLVSDCGDGHVHNGMVSSLLAESTTMGILYIFQVITEGLIVHVEAYLRDICRFFAFVLHSPFNGLLSFSVPIVTPAS